MPGAFRRGDLRRLSHASFITIWLTWGSCPSCWVKLMPRMWISCRQRPTCSLIPLRRKSVETKIILGGEPPEVDEVLIRNIVKARNWFEAIKRGETFAKIAAREGTSKRRIQDVVDLAFLAPDILQQVIAGTLPSQAATDVLIKRGVPGRWTEQRLLFKEYPAHSNAT